MAALADEPERKVVLKKTKGTTLYSSACLPYEIGNSLSAMVKRHRIDSKQAMKTIEVAMSIPVRLIDVNIEKALQIAVEENHYAYDAYYIECALAKGFPLFSLDNGLIEIAKKRGVKCL